MKRDLYSITRWFLYGLLAITVVVFLLFFAVGEPLVLVQESEGTGEVTELPYPQFMELSLYLCYAMGAITLFIAMAPSLGFLGTVIGMVMAFDTIQREGDISPTIVAGGMKVALITTIYGIIVALVLQVFYNFILTKIESIVADMEDSSITLLDLLTKYNLKK